MSDITQTIARSSGFVPDVWAARALDVLRSKIVLAKLVARDTEWEPGWVGQTLNIPYPGTFSAQSKTADTLATVQTPVGGATVQLVLDHHKYVDFLIEDMARAQANMDLMDRYIEPAAIALAEDLESNLIAAAISGWTANNAVGTSGTDLSAAPLRAARRVLNTQKVPTDSRALAFSPKDEAAILGDTNLQTYFAFAQQQAIREGSIGRLYGFDLYMSQLIGTDGTNQSFTIAIGGTPTGGSYKVTVLGKQTAAIAWNAVAADIQAAIGALTSVGSGNVTVTQTSGSAPNFTYTVTFIGDFAGGSIGGTVTGGQITVQSSLTGGTPTLTATDAAVPTTTNLAFHPNGLLLGTRPFRPVEPNSGVEEGSMIDTDSGLSLRVMHQYSMQYRSHYVGFDLLYGFVPLRPKFGIQVLS